MTFNVIDRFRLDDKVILITGATSGIGREVALACADVGATVVAIGRNPQKLEVLNAELNSISKKPHFVTHFDVTNSSAIPDLLTQAVARCGKISGFVHSAGIIDNCPIRAMESATYQKIFQTNVFSAFEFVKAISNKKNIADTASFVFISSISAIKGEAALLAYSSSKGAIISAVKSMAAELSKKHIRVNSLIPALLSDTEMGKKTVSPLSDEALNKLTEKHLLGLGKVDNIIGPMIFLLSDASIWITGTSLIVDGGYTL